jgi:hypothetical protein
MINDVFVSFGLDHDGEEAIHVKVNFARGTVKPPASATLDLIGSLTAFLRRSGDRRLVYVRNLFMDGPAADEEHRNTVARRRKS